MSTKLIDDILKFDATFDNLFLHNHLLCNL